ncbi:MAG: deoxyuridine 5'-triphosphate nucleotidohydrolase [Lachnospiraceae bacterium]|nr:deoxyuridine 5'-triphosphate nucleotidohydrolase [Lachnospiraceae bacterium]
MEFEYQSPPRVAKFSKVTKERFMADFADAFPDEAGRAGEIYENLRLPARATFGSAGYDFFMPVTVELAPGETVKIPTGIRAEMAPCYVLLLFPRSGLGFRYRLQLNNTVGVIDSDYFFSDNEGHIFAKVTNDSKEGKSVTLTADTGFMQGIFLPYGITVEDAVSEKRNGGFGSTTKK